MHGTWGGGGARDTFKGVRDSFQGGGVRVLLSRGGGVHFQGMHISSKISRIDLLQDF